MSSLVVRNAIKNFLAVEVPSEKIIDLSGHYEEIQDLVEDFGLTPDDNWVGIQYLGGDEAPTSLTANNTKGLYREYGVVYLHIVEVIQPNVQDLILSRAETLREKFRGQRIGNVTIEKVGPPNFGTGNTLQFTGNYVAAVFIVDYKFDNILP